MFIKKLLYIFKYSLVISSLYFNISSSYINCADITMTKKNTQVSSFLKAIATKDEIELKCLLKNDSNLRFYKNEKGCTVIHHALFHNAHNILIYLLQYSEQDINCHDECLKMTPLHWAVYMEDMVAVSILLSHNARRDIQDIFGYTPLHTACRYIQDDIKKQNIIALLLTQPTEFGKSSLNFEEFISIKDKTGLTAFDICPAAKRFVKNPINKSSANNIDNSDSQIVAESIMQEDKAFKSSSYLQKYCMLSLRSRL